MVKFDFDGWFKDTFGNNASLTMYNKYKNLKWHINPHGDLVFEYDRFFVNAFDVKKYIYENEFETKFTSDD